MRTFHLGSHGYEASRTIMPITIRHAFNISAAAVLSVFNLQKQAKTKQSKAKLKHVMGMMYPFDLRCP